MVPENKSALWEFSSEEFNQWRRINDLPKLLNYFREILPFFEEWQKEFHLTDDLILSHNHTGDFFLWEGELIFVSTEDKYKNCDSVQVISQKRLNELISLNLPEFRYWIFATFLPYFYWLHKIKRIIYFISGNDSNQSPVEKLSYRSWRWTEYKNTIQPILFHSFEVLSIWGETVTWKTLMYRNLDFMGLDNLIIENDLSVGWRYSKIQFSSLNNLTFKNIWRKNIFWPSSWAFLQINNSFSENIIIQSSNIQDLHFRDCWTVTFHSIEKSRLSNLIFDYSTPILWHMENVEFSNPTIRNIIPYQRDKISKYYEKLTLSYSKDWDYWNAWEMYFLKEKYMMLSFIYPTTLYWFIEYSRMFYDGIYTFKKYIEISFNLYRGIKWLTTINSYIKAILMFLSYTLWGFWERPYNALLISISIVLLFSANYWPTLDLTSISNNINSSLQTFLWIRNNPSFSESIISAVGLVCFGFLIAGLTNKRTY